MPPCSRPHAAEPASKKLKRGVFNVTIVTAGAHCELPNGNALSKNNILTNLVNEGAAGIRGVGYNKVYMYDLRSFKNPQSSKKYCRHIGFHPEIIKDVVLSPHFEPWLKRFRDVFWDKLHHDEHRPVCAFFGNSGRHNSVAMSEIVKCCLDGGGCRY